MHNLGNTYERACPLCGSVPPVLPWLTELKYSTVWEFLVLRSFALTF